MAALEEVPVESPDTEPERRQAKFASIVYSEMGLLRTALAEHGQLLAVIHQMVARQGELIGDIQERIRNIEIHVELIKGTLLINEITKTTR